MNKQIVGLDIGSSKICAVAGTVGPGGTLHIDAVSERPSEGIRAGAVENIENAMKVVTAVIEDIELQTGRELQELISGIGGGHISGVNSQGVVGFSGHSQEIRKEDILRSMEVARAIDLPLDREIIHTLVQDFQIDGRGGVKEPVDMLAHRLETKVMIVTGSRSISGNLVKCVERPGFKVKRLVLQQLADSDTILTRDEKEMGTLLVNIGGGTTNMIGYQGGAPIYTGGINLGGEQVTTDLAYILNKPRTIAEELKCTYGTCYTPMVGKHEDVIIPQIGGWPSIKLPKREISRIIEPRMAEIFSLLKGALNTSKISPNFGGGVVITGGGSLLPGTVELAAEVFGLPARLGIPEPLEGLEMRYLDPKYTTVLGLVLNEALRQRDRVRIDSGKSSRESGKDSSRSAFRKRMKNFFEVLF